MMQQPKYFRSLLLDETVTFLNNSRSKYECVGLSPHLNFVPAGGIGGSRVPEILISKEDWEILHDNQLVILNYLHGDKNSDDPLILDNVHYIFWIDQRPEGCELRKLQ